MHGRRRDKLDEHKLQVRKLYNDKLTDKEIADEMGVTRAAVSLWRKRNGLPRHSFKGRVYATWHHRAAMLYANGWTLEMVSEHVGKKHDTVRDIIRRMGGQGTL